MLITKLQKLGIALGVSLISINALNAQAATVRYQTNFEPFLPSTLNPGDSYNFSFRIHDPNRAKSIRIVKIIYHVITPLIANIFIPFFFENLSPQSSSNFTSPPGSTLPDGANLTLAGLGGFATTNSFTIPSDFGFTRSDILAANLSLELETDDLVQGDGFVASLSLNGTNIGSAVYEPIPEPSVIFGVLIFGGAMGMLKKKAKSLPLETSHNSVD